MVIALIILMFLSLFMVVFGLYLIKDKWLASIGVIFLILGVVVFILSCIDLIYSIV